MRSQPVLLGAVTVIGLLAACSVSGSAVSRTPVPSAPAASAAPRIAAPASPGVVNTPRSAAPSAAATVAAFTLPTANANFDYQLGGAYTPPVGVTMVSRDRTDPPVPGLYNVCYVNGFQTQPGEASWWLANHPTLVLRDGGGSPVIDPDWPDEYILDISTPTKRSEIAAIVGPWIAGCAASGFQSVEIDNLDTYTRFPAQLGEADAVAMISAYVDTAHDQGLAIAQKNSAELVAKRSETNLDFAVAEQCSQYDECDVYTAGYGNLVFVIEYQESAFTTACAAFPGLSIVLRDVDLTTPSSRSYVRQVC